MGRVWVDVLRVGLGTGTKSTGRVYPFLPVKNTIFHDVVVCLSVVCNVRAPIQGMKFSAMFLRHLIQWPSVDIQVKFYGDRPRGTSPSVELKTRRVADYRDFGPIERFILETVQDRS